MSIPICIFLSIYKVSTVELCIMTCITLISKRRVVISTFDYETFMSSIKLLRKNEGLTEYQLSIFSDIDYPTYSKYECGERKPSTDEVLKLVNHFGVSIADCLGDEESLKRRYQTKKLLAMLEKVKDAADLKIAYNALIAMKKVNSE